MSTRFSVKVDADQFDRLARQSQPLAGVAELIWLSKHGKRPLHGRNGEGRFRALALGRSAEWSTVAEGPRGSLERTVVRASIDDSELEVSEPEELATGNTGTTVRTTTPREDVNRLLADSAVTWLITRFAVYLTKYPNVAVSYDGTRLDPASIVARQIDRPLTAVARQDWRTPQLRILEWSPAASTIRSSLVLCDENGVALHETELPDGSSGIRFTAYVTWAGFSPHWDELPVAELDPVLGPVVEAAQAAVREYLETRVVEQRVGIIERWKAERVYPYAEPPATPIEQHERRMFDAVAVTAAPAVAKEPAAARLSLRLLRAALAESPAALHRVLREVLELTPNQLVDLDRLLQRATLASLIHTGKLVTDRLDFLADLEAMLFDDTNKKRLLERRQLHRILANGRTWVFGEDYSLAVDDQGLTKVLTAHRQLGGDGEPVTEPVTDPEGRTRIVDLMLSRASFARDHRQHLVVELKRPKVRVTQHELAQITNYAVAVVKDERFHSPNVTWDFWLVGDDIDPVVSEITNTPDRPSGLYQQGRSFRIWVKRWAEVLEENRQRLHFYRDHLDYQPGADVDLQTTLSRYLPRQQSELIAVGG